jgi:NTE family protein
MKQLKQLNLFVFLIFLFLGTMLHAQRVGVVLSGGGATAGAHVGFLRALEEAEIPIDYICGTSMGAVIGGFYASGYSVDQIDSILSSKAFIDMTEGELDDDYTYYFKKFDADASMGTIKFAKGKFITSSIPTNLNNPVQLDFQLMEYYAQAAGTANYDFDKLYIPFRCNASDIEAKEEVIFRNGSLATAIRASMTYPFFVEPIRVNGRLLFDGGLYNNFPSNICYHDFLPDVILGCNVSENAEPPQEDDFLSQLTNMVTYKTNFEQLCDEMIIIEPEAQVGTFDFEDLHLAIEKGYEASIEKIEEIKSIIPRRVTAEERNAGRAAFHAGKQPLIFDEITITGLDKTQKSYVKRMISKKDGEVSLDRLKTTYFRAFADDKVRSIFPTAVYNRQKNKYLLNLDVKKEKDVFLSVGGLFSSRPINTGFIGLKYNLFGRTSSTLEAKSYFGKFYGSLLLSARIDFAGRLPFSIEPNMVFNRWDYFTSFATFFEDVQPSFIVINERFGGLRFRFPVRSQGKLELSTDFAVINDDYYQTPSFLATDTADRTRITAGIADLKYERNTLNRKQFAKKGTFLSIQAKYLRGDEITIPGSTFTSIDTLNAQREWLVGKLKYINYFQKIGRLRIGMMGEAVASTQPFMRNHVSTLIAAPAFQPIPESQTFFIKEYRAHNYVAGGLMLVSDIGKNIDIRAEAYAFRPLGRLEQRDDGLTNYNWDEEVYFIASSSIIYHSPIGPLSFAVNYYDQKENQWSAVLNFGYLLFNRSVRNI